MTDWEMTGGSICEGVPAAAADIKELRKAIMLAEPGSGRVVREIEACRFELSERGFTMLIIACKRYGSWRVALEILEAMKGERMAEKGVRPNFFTYSSLISVCCASAACDQALQLYGEMVELSQSDPELKPDETIYNPLIVACHKYHRPADATELYETMLPEYGDKVCKKTLVSVLECYGSVAKWRDAFDTLDVLVAAGETIPVETYVNLLSSCADQKAAATGVEVFLGMQMAGVCPNSTACHHMALVAAAGKVPEMCLELVRSMREAGITVSSSTYNCVIPLLCEGEMWDAALEIYGLVREQGITITVESEKLRELLLRAGELE